MAYSVYILRSESGKYYIGQTADLEDRLARHNNNSSKSTRLKGPWELVISYECQSRSEAVLLEGKLKRLKSAAKAIRHLEILHEK